MNLFSGERPAATTVHFVRLDSSIPDYTTAACPRAAKVPGTWLYDFTFCGQRYLKALA